MGWFSDVMDFEAFNLKDMWKKIKKDPERLLIGAADPWSTKLWNKVLGKDYEPIVDQMGGAYGGHTLSAFGNTDDGAYKRAADAGINIEPGAAMHDAAHVIAALYAGGYGLGKLGGAGSSASTPGQQPSWQQNIPQLGQQQTQPIVDPREEERKRKEEEARRRRAAALAASLRATGNQGLV